jgi:hypothetical protein
VKSLGYETFSDVGARLQGEHVPIPPIDPAAMAWVTCRHRPGARRILCGPPSGANRNRHPPADRGLPEAVQDPAPPPGHDCPPAQTLGEGRADPRALQRREVAAGLDDLVRTERAKHHSDDPAHHDEEAAES